MRALTLSSGLLVFALIGGPQAAVAQNEFPFCHRASMGSLDCSFASLEQCRRGTQSLGGECLPNPATTGRGVAIQLPPPGGGEFLPSPSEPNPANTDRSTSTRLPPAGGGEFLPPPAR
jgi:hypothetical protein